MQIFISLKFFLYTCNLLFITAYYIEWKKKIDDFSNWVLNSMGTSTNKEENENISECIPFQKDIPKLPVPDLQHTLKRYLETLQPIISETEFQKTKIIVDNFGSENGIGSQLQQVLLKRQETEDNWVYEWWLNDMYLNNQSALPINSNPGMVFPIRKTSGAYDVLTMSQFAARIVTTALAYKNKIERNELPIETINCDGKIQPVCMKQYHRIFTSYRIPGILKDSLIKSETEYTKARPHIVVVCNEQFYIIHLTKGKNAEPMSENELIAQFSSIIEENQRDQQRTKTVPIGILTGLKRDIWASVREQLILDQENQKNISLIEKCIFIICFDLKILKSTFNSKYYIGNKEKNLTRDETNMSHQMIHGGGSAANSGNRWFDKTIQIIIGIDGANGLCYEHSPAEGVAVINAIETILSNCESFHAVDEVVPLKTPTKLSWNISYNIERQIYTCLSQFDSFVEDLDFNVFRFKHYGKNFIKSCCVSPDAFIQVALQLAYYKLNGKLCATYESASTRRFLLGRVDCIRANTMEVLNWVTAMHEPSVKMEKKLNLMIEAIRKQTEITKENISGHGIDIHLLGLRQVAKDLMLKVDLFENDAYKIANNFLLSTSQVATKINGFMGYGPVVPNGYGTSYNPKEDSIIFCISSFYSNKNTSTVRFTEQLEKSLISMKELLLKYKK